jgi:alpha-1,3-glucosyltransferase
MAAAILHILDLIVHPPSRYPDLFPVLNVLISTPVFVLVLLWSIKSGIEVGWALGGLGRSNSDEQIKEVSEETVSGSGSPCVIVKSR